MTACLSGISSWAFLLVGILLMLLGLVVLLFGVGGGIATMVREVRHTPSATADFDPFESLEKVVNAVAALLKALSDAKGWLALVVVGFLMIFAGAWLLSDAGASLLGAG